MRRLLDLGITNYFKARKEFNEDPSRFSSVIVEFDKERPSNKFFADKAALEKCIQNYNGPHTNLYAAAKNWTIDVYLSNITSQMSLLDRNEEAAEIMSKLFKSENNMEMVFSEYKEIIENAKVKCIGDPKQWSEESKAIYKSLHASQWFIDTIHREKLKNIWDEDVLRQFSDEMETQIAMDKYREKLKSNK